jgi:hypothetical protein
VRGMVFRKVGGISDSFLVFLLVVAVRFVAGVLCRVRIVRRWPFPELWGVGRGVRWRATVIF